MTNLIEAALAEVRRQKEGLAFSEGLGAPFARMDYCEWSKKYRLSDAARNIVLLEALLAYHLLEESGHADRSTEEIHAAIDEADQAIRRALAAFVGQNSSTTKENN